MMEVHALLRRSSKRKTRTCNKDVYAAAHVTWSKLKLNCTNPSYRLTIHFLCASLSTTGQTDYYSVLFPFFFRMSSSSSRSKCFSSRSFISSLFYYFIFPQSSFRCFVYFHIRLFRLKQFLLLVLVWFHRDIDVFSLLLHLNEPFILKHVEPREEEAAKKLNEKKRYFNEEMSWSRGKNWQHLIN